jgi:hypothetical protein
MSPRTSTGSFPVPLTDTYELNGQQVSSSQVSSSSSKGAVLLASYKIANVTKQTPTVHYTSPNGARHDLPTGT